ncbi:MAG TPA: acetate uptake transporter, partial [Acidimicrobiales bacterium]|nr:acetate uptake transporter [Acidimicrobiales bacterium]
RRASREGGEVRSRRRRRMTVSTTLESAGPVAQSEVTIKAVPPAADPAPLGLAGFALTTFLLSIANAHWTKGSATEWLGYALAYGGGAQLLAGMWEFKNRNVFGATAFSTYGAFWIGLALYVKLGVTATSNGGNDLGWILVAFFIFNTYMLLWSLFVTKAVLGVFLALEIALCLLWIGNLWGNVDVVEAGGVAGVVTAAVAWYASAAGVINGMAGRHVLFVGKPFAIPGSRRA